MPPTDEQLTVLDGSLRHRHEDTPTGLPSGLRGALKHVRTRELHATGTARLPAFRTTGQLLGAAVTLGYPARLLADCIGTSPGSVRSRLRAGGEFEAEAAVRVTGYSLMELGQHADAGRLPNTRRAASGAIHYAVTDLVALLAAKPAPGDHERAPADPEPLNDQSS